MLCRVYTKYVLREVSRDFLPDYIADREKVPFANGAGLDVGNNFTLSDGVISRIAEQEISDTELEIAKQCTKGINFRTKEEVLLFKHYEKFGFTKFICDKRPVMKDTLVEFLYNESLSKEDRA